MTPVELLGLSLAASVGVAALGWLGASGLERACGDAGLRERLWDAALFLPVLPPLVTALLLLTPAPVQPAPVMTASTAEATATAFDLVEIAPAAEGFNLDGGHAALIVLTAALLLTLARLVVLARRARRVKRLCASAVPASSSTLQAVTITARRMGVAAPQVRVCASGAEAWLTGLVRPVLILPARLAEASNAPVARAVIAHELAHLKRGDHRTVWREEVLLALLAFNPVLPFVRARRAAAREEACDALALSGQTAETRRAYAQALIEALGSHLDPSPTPEGLSKVMEAPILSAYGLPSQVFLDLDDRFFPSRMPGRAYELKAEIRGADGRLAYVSEPTTLRLAPGSQRQAMRMRPELILRPAF